MPDIAAALRQEIARISRREMRSTIGPLKKASALQRRHIASLKKHVALLEREVRSLARRVDVGHVPDTARPADKPTRFVPKGLRSLRRRLNLSVSDMARLVGVSGQSIYNWEHEVTKPRAEQLKVLSAIKGLGKREVTSRLAALSVEQPAGGRR